MKGLWPAVFLAHLIKKNIYLGFLYIGYTPSMTLGKILNFSDAVLLYEQWYIDTLNEKLSEYLPFHNNVKCSWPWEKEDFWLVLSSVSALSASGWC